VICLNRSVLDFMDSVITPESFVLEFGAGYSTPWFAERCNVASVETDFEWYEKAASMAPNANLFHSIESPVFALDLINNSFDLALIDGEAKYRNEFTRAAWPKVKKGGWLVFDDAQRPQHASAVAWLNTFTDPVELRWSEGDVESAKDRLALAWQR
jgi:predicted O-methyltransferase YrrM